MATTKPIPDGFHTITPYLVVDRASELIDFLKRAFEAKEIHRSTTPDGRVAHATLQIGDSMLMMGQAKGEWKATTTSIYMYVEEVDKIYRRAMDAGGVSVQEPQDMFYGDRHGGVKDPSGNTWWIATHKEDVSPEEIERRMHTYAGQH